jgi:hypothetical protein
VTKRLELAGFKHPEGRLTAKQYAHSNDLGVAIWDFDCDCGNQIQAIGFLVHKGKLKSCGCLAKDQREEAAKKYVAFEEEKSLKDWAKDDRCEVSLAGIRSRLAVDPLRDFEEVITTPSRNTYGGKPKTERVPLKELLWSRMGKYRTP